MPTSRFVKFIAYMQVIGIILVVLGHSFHEYPDGHHGTSMLMYRMMFSFRMPTFMFVSGFLMAYTTFLNKSVKIKSVTEFVKSKIQRLLVPYFVLTLVTFVPRAILSNMADDKIDLTIVGLIKAFLYMENMPVPLYWFIQASFLLLVFSFAVISLSDRMGGNRSVCQVGLVVLFVCLPFSGISEVAFFSLGYAVKLGLFFCLGIMYAHWFTVLDKVVAWQSLGVFMLVSLTWGMLFFLTEHTVLYPLCQMTGICMVISLAHILEYRKIRWLDHLIGANYMIFLLSWYFNVLSQQVLAHFVNWPWYVHTSLSMILGIYIPFLIYKGLKYHQDAKWVRIVSYVLGQNIRKKTGTEDKGDKEVGEGNNVIENNQVR